jgi:hypothetical protein
MVADAKKHLFEEKLQYLIHVFTGSNNKAVVCEAEIR